MNKKQKALVAKAELYPLGTPLDGLYVIPSGRLYKGFFDKKKWEHMILVGYNIENEKYYLIENSEHEDIDVVTFFHFSHVFSVDIPHEYEAIRLVFDNPVKIDEIMSAVTPREIVNMPKIRD